MARYGGYGKSHRKQSINQLDYNENDQWLPWCVNTRMIGVKATNKQNKPTSNCTSHRKEKQTCNNNT